MASVPWIKVSTSFFTHRKTIKLRAILGESEPILRLWAWAAQCADNGDLSGISTAEIEDAIGWRGKQGKAFEAFVACGFIDKSCESVTIHGWDEHTGGGVKRMLTKRDKQRDLMRERRKAGLVSPDVIDDVIANNGDNKDANERGTSSLLSSSLSSSGSDSSMTRDPLPSRPKHMQASAWFEAFNLEWCKKKEKLRYAHSSDSVARGRFDTTLSGLDPGDVLEAWNRKSEVFAEFLGTNDRKVQECGHIFAFFVNNFMAYMIPKAKRKDPKPYQEKPHTWKVVDR